MTGTITTHNTRYDVTIEGYITSHGQHASHQWAILGAVRYNNFGHQVAFIPFDALASLNGRWRHKNGAQRWHIMDNDHGTLRVWMSPGHSATFTA